MNKYCSKCNKEHNRTNQRYCKTCHAAYMRHWRLTNKLTPFQRAKDNARSYAGVYKRRGKLIPQECSQCGSSDVEMHHEDYARPLYVEWLCRYCHLVLHNGNDVDVADHTRGRE